MRLAFFLAILLNLAFYVWSAGYLGGHADGREPERLDQQIAADKLRVSVLAPDATAKQKKPAEAETIECKAIGGLAAAEAATVEQALKDAPGLTVSLRPLAEEAAHWVLIGGLTNRAAAEKKAQEVRQRGIEDFKLMEDEAHGPFAVSLGLFSSAEAAQEHLQSLARKGIRSARIERRAAPSSKASIEIRATARRLEGLAEALVNYPEAKLGECPAAH